MPRAIDKGSFMKKSLGFLIAVFLATTAYTDPCTNTRSFETVWQTVNDKHFDPTFGGLDWKGLHDQYQPKIAEARSDSEFYALVNQMLFELNLSHFLVASHDDLKRFMPTLFAEGSIGLDVRLLDGAAVITSVRPESPGARAGLRAGFVIQRIDGVTIEQIVAEGEKTLLPPFNRRNRRNNLTLQMLGRIYGPPNTRVSISYLDEQGDEHETIIQREPRGCGRVISEALPRFFLEFEAKRLENNIGYVRFNHFAEPVDEAFIRALGSMRDAPGLILDLRGNSGGYFRTVNIIARHLLTEKALFSTFRFRNRTIDSVLDPIEGAYQGPVVVLIDVLSMSAGEHFAGCMQATGRALIVGDHSPGYLLVASWMKLPNGAAFMHTIGLTRTPDGRLLEGLGVVPDIEVKQDRNALLDGRDPQLDAAIRYIQNRYSSVTTN
jgi:carboxyl-terminal processing protease